jgi:hypothetical protein
MKQQANSFSSRLISPKPIFFINKSIFLQDGEEINIDDWVENNDIKASFTLNWYKNTSVESYNVYCTVPGKDSSKTVIVSADILMDFGVKCRLTMLLVSQLCLGY